MAARARLIGAHRDRVGGYTLLPPGGRLDVQTLGLNTPDYAPEIHYQSGAMLAQACALPRAVRRQISGPAGAPGARGRLALRDDEARQRRDHEQAADRRQQHAADDHAGQRLLNLEPIPVEIAAGTSPMHAEKPVMKICRIRVSAALMIAFSVPMPSSISRRM